MVFISTSIILDRLIKMRNHTVSCWKKCVSFKDIKGLRSGLRSGLRIWGFTFGSDQTFVMEIVVSYW